MSQQYPEPDEPTISIVPGTTENVPAETLDVPAETPEASVEATSPPPVQHEIPPPPPLAPPPPPPPPSVEAAADLPPAPLEMPLAAVVPLGPMPVPRPDLRQQSMLWMQKSLEITSKLLYDLGNWIFGGLIVANLMLLQALIGLGFADRAILVAGLATVLALPFNLAGLGLIRYFNSLNQAAEEARQVLAQNGNLDAGTLIRLTNDSSVFSSGKRQVMDSSVSLALYLSTLFTVVGFASALWHISWAVTLFFIISSVVGVLLVVRVIRYS
ncbi:MAG TPA: hypothetical protein VGD98_00900 [Ktedonobacteraceae bacterium]